MCVSKVPSPPLPPPPSPPPHKLTDMINAVLTPDTIVQQLETTAPPLLYVLGDNVFACHMDWAAVSRRFPWLDLIDRCLFSLSSFRIRVKCVVVYYVTMSPVPRNLFFCYFNRNLCRFLPCWHVWFCWQRAVHSIINTQKMQAVSWSLWTMQNMSLFISFLSPVYVKYVRKYFHYIPIEVTPRDQYFYSRLHDRDAVRGSWRLIQVQGIWILSYLAAF